MKTLRNIFRNLYAFRAVYETDGISEITGPDGVTWSLWDIEELRRIAVETDLLPPRARQAIELFLVMNMSESDVAEMMSLKASNPIGMYATAGLVRLLERIDQGLIFDPWADNSKAEIS